MKKYGLIAVLLTGTGAVAQTPAAPPPMAKPGLTLTTPAFDDGGIIPNKYTQAAENGAPPRPRSRTYLVPVFPMRFPLRTHACFAFWQARIDPIWESRSGEGAKSS